LRPSTPTIDGAATLTAALMPAGRCRGRRRPAHAATRRPPDAVPPEPSSARAAICSRSAGETSCRRFPTSPHAPAEQALPCAAQLQQIIGRHGSADAQARADAAPSTRAGLEARLQGEHFPQAEREAPRDQKRTCFCASRHRAITGIRESLRRPCALRRRGFNQARDWPRTRGCAKRKLGVTVSAVAHAHIGIASPRTSSASAEHRDLTRD